MFFLLIKFSYSSSCKSFGCQPCSIRGVFGQIWEISNHPLKSKIMFHYNRIAESVRTHSTIPSFMKMSEGSASSYEMSWNGSQYVLELTDTNNVLSGCSFSSSDSNMKFSVSGNKLKITLPNAPNGSVTITASKKNSQRMGVITWSDGKVDPKGGKPATSFPPLASVLKSKTTIHNLVK